MAYEVKSHDAPPISINEVFPPKELRTTARKYYIYRGSSSVPPCVEGLIYLVLAKVCKNTQFYLYSVQHRLMTYELDRMPFNFLKLIKYVQVRSISSDQVQALKGPLDMGCKYNARPCQLINGRQVYVYKQFGVVEGQDHHHVLGFI